MKREAKPRTHSGILSMKNHKAENYTSTLFLKHFFCLETTTEEKDGGTST